MRKLLFSLLLIGAFFLGFHFSKPQSGKKNLSYLREEKPISILLYAKDQEAWIEKSLRSSLEQDYENYQVILIVDGSSDNTLELAKNLILETGATARVLLIKNEIPIGYEASIHEVLQDLDPSEIVLPFFAKDFLANELCLKKLNTLFVDPKVKIVSAKAISYPTYDTKSCEIKAFRAPAFFKKAGEKKIYLKGKQAQTEEVLLLLNKAA